MFAVDSQGRMEGDFGFGSGNNFQNQRRFKLGRVLAKDLKDALFLEQLKGFFARLSRSVCQNAIGSVQDIVVSASFLAVQVPATTYQPRRSLFLVEVLFGILLVTSFVVVAENLGLPPLGGQRSHLLWRRRRKSSYEGPRGLPPPGIQQGSGKHYY